MRYLILLGIMAGNLIFANTIFPHVNVFGLAPDLIICTTVSLIIYENSFTGAWLGLLCGLFLDLFPGVIGFYALPYFLAGALVFFVRKNVPYIDKMLLPVGFAVGAYFLKELLFALLAYLLDKQFSLATKFVRYMLPEAVLTGALMLLVHFLFGKLVRLPAMKKRSREDFRRIR